MKVLFVQYFKYLLLLALISVPIFGHLESLPIRVWDESRQAVGALEMYLNDNFFVVTYENSPDLWNTKPPLLVWFQVFFMNIFGPGELAVRLPSALAAFFTCLIIVWFTKRHLNNNFWLGFITVLVLITSQGYIGHHIARTGDYDSLLTFLNTLAALSFFIFIDTKRRIYLYAFFIALTLAVLTKSIAGLLFAPVYLLYALWRKEFINLLKNKHFYIGTGIFLFGVFGFYLLREYLDPGYLEAVWANDLGGRYLGTLDNHKHGPWYYFNNLIDYRFTYWYLLVPCGILLGLLQKDARMRNITLYSSLLVLVHMVVISNSQTKLEWYDAAIFPFASFLAGIAVHVVFDFIKTSEYFTKTMAYNIAPFVFLILILKEPYQDVLRRTNTPKEYPWDVNYYAMSHLLQDAVRGKVDLSGYDIYFEGYHAHVLFYEKILELQGSDTELLKRNDPVPGDKVIVNQEEAKEYLRQNFEVTVIKEDGPISYYSLESRK